MNPIYDKPVRVLMKDMVTELGLRPGQIITRERVRHWFRDRYPKIKEGTISCHLIRMSTNAPSRVHYSAKLGEDDLFFQIDGSQFRLYESAKDPQPITSATAPDAPEMPEEPEEEKDAVSEFAYERDLRNFLAKNLAILEPGLRLYEEEGITGIEFPAGGRFIDILGVDKENRYVVIELKVSRGYDRVVGQLLRYINWVRKNQAEEGQGVRGVIVAREISEDLLLACSDLRDVQLFEYELSLSLKEVGL
jgi:endonuclease